MGRLARDSRLETREARNRLPARHDPYWRLIEKGFYLGYRRGRRGKAGTWIARTWVNGKYRKKGLGKADDFGDDNGADVMGYKRAQAAARDWADKEARRRAEIREGPYTVSNAVAEYLEWYADHRKSHSKVQGVCKNHIKPKLGSVQVDELTTRGIRAWHEAIAKQAPFARTGIGKERNFRKSTSARARKATANRALTILKAALNHAWRDGQIASDVAWRKVRPFRNVESPRIRFFEAAECQRLVNACPPDFRQLVQGALYTGCRYGELIRMKCADFNAQVGVVSIDDSKSGKSRHVPLTQQGQAFFKRLKVGRKGSAWMFRRSDGEPWGESHQIRPIKAASKIADIDPPATFHSLRHTYGSALAQRGVPLQVIAEALGHADTRITSRHYAHLQPSYVADTIRKHLPDFGKFEADNVTTLKV